MGADSGVFSHILSHCGSEVQVIMATSHSISDLRLHIGATHIHVVLTIISLYYSMLSTVRDKNQQVTICHVMSGTSSAPVHMHPPVQRTPRALCLDIVFCTSLWSLLPISGSER